MVYTHTKITEGQFKGSHKVSWLNAYDFTIIKDGEDTMEISLLKTLAQAKGLYPSN